MAQVADKVKLEFEHGRTSDVVDLVVGADGIHSFVAEAMDIDHSEPLYVNANIFGGVINDDDASMTMTSDKLTKFSWTSPVLQDMPNTVIQNNYGVGESKRKLWKTAP